MQDVVFDSVPSLREFIATVESLPWSGRFTLIFRNHVDVYTHFSGRKIKKTDRLNRVMFFTSASGGTCYTIHRRTGYPVNLLPFSELARIIPEKTLTDEEARLQKIKQIVAIQRRIHPNAWDDLKLDPPEKFLSLGGPFSILRKFSETVIDALKDAFKYRWEYSHREFGLRRELSVETKVCKDGIFRAWFSSEYAGCANGCYYALINPTTAAFGEYD